MPSRFKSVLIKTFFIRTVLIKFSLDICLLFYLAKNPSVQIDVYPYILKEILSPVQFDFENYTSKDSFCGI